MPESKSRQIFRGRIEHLEQFLEAMDAASRITINILGHKRNEGRYIPDALPIKCDSYRTLNHPTNHRKRIYNYCKSKINSTAIIENYTHFTEYMKNILKEMYNHDPLRVVNKSNKDMNMKFHKVVELGDFESIKNHMISEVFRSLENERSTKKLIDRVIRGTGVNITDYDKNMILPYLEMRHLLMHNKGKIDANFESKFGTTFSLKKNDKVPTDYNNASKALLETDIFVRNLDTELIENGCIRAKHE